MPNRIAVRNIYVPISIHCNAVGIPYPGTVSKTVAHRPSLAHKGADLPQRSHTKDNMGARYQDISGVVDGDSFGGGPKSRQSGYSAFRRYLPNLEIVTVGHIDVAGIVNRHPGGMVETGINTRPVEEPGGTAGVGRNHTDGRYLPYPIVLGVRNEDVSVNINSNTLWRVETRGVTYSIGSPPRTSQSCKCACLSGWGNLAYGMIVAIGDEEVACIVHSNAFRIIELRLSANAVLAAVAGMRTGYGCHGTGRSHLPDRAVSELGNVEIAGTIQCQPRRIAEPRVDAYAIPPAGTACKARHGCHLASRSDLSNGIIHAIRDIKISRAVHRDSCRGIEACIAPLAVGRSSVAG